MPVKADWRNALLMALGVLVAALVPLWGGDTVVGIGIDFFSWLALAQSWVLFSGLTGYVSLGHVVFYGLGAYITAISWSVVPIPVALAAGVLGSVALAMSVGYPFLRVRGPYFVMLTFGLAQFVKFVIIEIEALLQVGGRLVMGGPSTRSIYWMLLTLASVAMIMLGSVRYARFGSGLRAIKEDETAAETIGIPTVRYKLLAYVLSAAIPGAVGGVLLMRAGYFEPDTVFDPTLSLMIVCIAIVGGENTPTGAICGTVFLIGLSELLWARFPLFYMIILGALLITFVLVVPHGITGLLLKLLPNSAAAKKGV